MFTDPFPGIKEINPMSKVDLIRAIRLDLALEQDATAVYTAHAEASPNTLATKVLRSIANEERVHIGELLRLIETLDPEETKFLENGAAEVENFKEFAENWR